MRSIALGAALLTVACGHRPNGDVIDAPPIDAAAIVLDARNPWDAAVATCTPVHGTTITIEPFAQAFTAADYVTAPKGDGRVFVVEQTGTIRIVEHGQVRATPFLDLSPEHGGPVSHADTEMGLLGLAFHPDYANNGRFYVQYTRTDWALVTEELTVSADPYVADPTTAREVLVVPHPGHRNHNSGTIAFGNDGFLYVSTGDGGGENDPTYNARNKTSLLGKMLRIDVDRRTGSKGYGIPPTNPYAASPDGAADPRPEIWSMGWRNPYRWSFDPDGDMIVAEVGEALIEEVDVIQAGSQPPEDFGWNEWEGDSCFIPPCTTTGFHMPQLTHSHNDGWCAIIGGATYQGSCYPDLVGQYFYTDYCKHELWSFTPSGGQAQGDHLVSTAVMPKQPTSIARDALGEIYLTSRANGVLFHIVAGP